MRYVSKGSLLPRPKPDDEIIFLGKHYKIYFYDGTNPYDIYFYIVIDNDNATPYKPIKCIYTNITGWLASYYYISKNNKVEVYTKEDLKKLNMDGRNSCASCNLELCEPYPRIRYCKICEK